MKINWSLKEGLIPISLDKLKVGDYIIVYRTTGEVISELDSVKTELTPYRKVSSFSFEHTNLRWTQFNTNSTPYAWSLINIKAFRDTGDIPS